MQKFMKRWHKRNGSGDEEEKGEKGDKSEKMDQDGDQGKQGEEEFLKNVGECVSNMLGPFGKL